MDEKELTEKIENMRKEIIAHEDLRRGYTALSELPSIDEKERALYLFRAKANNQLANTFQNLLDVLIALFKAQKGIK